MITAKMTHCGNCYTLDVDGHAGFNPGNDVVCSGVSVLCQSLMSWCANSDEAHITELDARSGKFHIIAFGRTHDVFSMVALGLKGIEANYPKNISVNIENIFKTCLAKSTLPLAE